MKYYCYVLKSERNGRYYIGQTADLDDRMKRHNKGDSKSTKHGIPWRLIHTEEFGTRSEAVKRERHLKSPKGWFELKRIKTGRGAAW